MQGQAGRACRCLLPGGRRQEGRKAACESGRGLDSRAALPAVACCPKAGGRKAGQQPVKSSL